MYAGANVLPGQQGNRQAAPFAHPKATSIVSPPRLQQLARKPWNYCAWQMSYNTSGSRLVELSAKSHSRREFTSATLALNNNRQQHRRTQRKDKQPSGGHWKFHRRKAINAPAMTSLPPPIPLVAGASFPHSRRGDAPDSALFADAPNALGYHFDLLALCKTRAWRPWRSSGTERFPAGQDVTRQWRALSGRVRRDGGRAGTLPVRTASTPPKSSAARLRALATPSAAPGRGPTPRRRQPSPKGSAAAPALPAWPPE